MREFVQIPFAAPPESNEEPRCITALPLVLLKEGIDWLLVFCDQTCVEAAILAIWRNNDLILVLDAGEGVVQVVVEDRVGVLGFRVLIRSIFILGQGDQLRQAIVDLRNESKIIEGSRWRITHLPQVMRS